MNKLNGINRRNTETVTQAMKDMYDKIYEQQETINRLNAGLSALQERLNGLESQSAIYRASSFGFGASSL